MNGHFAVQGHSRSPLTDFGINQTPLCDFLLVINTSLSLHIFFSMAYEVPARTRDRLGCIRTARFKFSHTYIVHTYILTSSHAVSKFGQICGFGRGYLPFITHSHSPWANP